MKAFVRMEKGRLAGICLLLLGTLFCFFLIRQNWRNLYVPCVTVADTNIGAGDYPRIIAQQVEKGRLSILDEEGNLCWQDIVPAGEITPSAETGEGLEAGNYTVRLEDSSWMASFVVKEKRMSETTFQVTDSPIYTQKDVFVLGETSYFYYDPELVGEESWFGVYQRGQTPGVENSALWMLAENGTLPDGVACLQEMSGDWTVFNSYPGEYTLYFFADSGYDALASWDFSVVETDEPVLRWLPSGTAGAGQLGGSVAVICPEDQLDQTTLLCWGRGGEPLPDVTPLRRMIVTGGTIRWLAPDGVVIPQEATQLLLYEYEEGASLESCDLLATLQLPVELQAVDEEPLYTFGVLSDTHVTRWYWNDQNQRTNHALDQLAALGVDFIVDNGDVVDNGSPLEYFQFTHMAKNTGVPVYLTFGNHDAGKNTGDFNTYLHRFLEAAGRNSVYARLDGVASRCLLLGSQGASPEDETPMNATLGILRQDQLDWLDTQLEILQEEDSTAPIFLFLHQPLAGTVTDTGWGSDLYPSEEVLARISDLPQLFLFTGHIHRSLMETWAVWETEGGAHFLHDGCASELWDGTDLYPGSEGLVVEVYADSVVIRGRDFLHERWMGSYYQRYPLGS